MSQSTLTTTHTPRFWTGDQSRPTSNLSLHGFFVPGTVADQGSVHDGVLEFPDQGSLPIRIRVRSNADGRTHCYFYDLTLKQQAQLKSMINQYQGQANDALNDLSYDQIAMGAGSRTAVAAPPVTTNGSANGSRVNGNGAKPSAKAAAPASAPARTDAGPGKRKGVIAIGVLLFGILAIAATVFYFFKSQLSIPVHNAVLLGNFVPVKASSEGILEKVFVRDGEHVSPGDPLFRIVDQKVENAFVQIDAAIRAAEVERDNASQEVAAAKQQFTVTASNLKNDLAVVRAAANAAKVDVQRTEAIAARLRPLAERQVIVMSKYEEAVMAHQTAMATAEMHAAEVDRLRERERLLKESNLLMVGDRLDQSLAQAQSRLASAEAQLAELHAQRTHLEEQRKHFTVHASSPGSVYASYLKAGSFVKVGGEVLALATQQENWAVGHVTQKMALKVLPGQNVRIHLKSMGVSATGKVAAIGHRGVYSQSGWNPDFRADPTLVPIKVTLPDIPYDIPAGLRIGMTIQLDHRWPWEDNEASKALPHESESATVQTQPSA